MKTFVKTLTVVSIVGISFAAAASDDDDLVSKTLNSGKPTIQKGLVSKEFGGGAGGMITPSTPKIFETITEGYRGQFLPNPNQVNNIDNSEVEINNSHTDNFDTIRETYKAIPKNKLIPKPHSE